MKLWGKCSTFWQEGWRHSFVWDHAWGSHWRFYPSRNHALSGESSIISLEQTREAQCHKMNCSGHLTASVLEQIWSQSPWVTTGHYLCFPYESSRRESMEETCYSLGSMRTSFCHPELSIKSPDWYNRPCVTPRLASSWHYPACCGLSHAFLALYILTRLQACVSVYIKG